MSKSRFEQMGDANPVPPESSPMAPMGVAARIIGARSRWPAWAVAAATAVAVVVVGAGSVWLLGGDGGGDAAGPSTTGAISTTSVAPDTSVVPTTIVNITVAPETSVTPTTGYTTTSLGVEHEFQAIVYLLADGVADTARAGPYLVPVALTVRDQDVAAGTLRGLMGATIGDLVRSFEGLSTAIPTGLELQSIDLEAGLAEVVFVDAGSFFDLFESDPDQMDRRLAQVVFTLTGLAGVDGVRFGQQAETPAALLHTRTRDDFADLLPAILIETPPYLGTGERPLIVSGTANVFEATVSLALTDGDGLILWEGFATAACGTGCRGDWAVEIPYEVAEDQMGSLIAWEESAEDGSQTNLREHPVWLLASEGAEPTVTTLSPDVYECSGGGTESAGALLDQPDLPEAVAATRAAIRQAAAECDWDELGGLIGPEFTYSFGGGGDATGHWQQLEIMGGEPMRFLVGLLDRPFALLGTSDEPYYVWPSAFGPEWPDVPDADRKALLPLYDDQDFAGFEDLGGYVGYRVGIGEGGTWMFFVDGD